MCAHPPLRFGCSPAAPACARLAPWLLGGVDAAPCGVAYHPLVACAQEKNSAPWPFGLAGWIPPLAQTATTPLRSLAPWRGGCRPLRGRLPPLSRLRRFFACAHPPLRFGCSPAAPMLSCVAVSAAVPPSRARLSANGPLVAAAALSSPLFVCSAPSL